MWWTVPFTPCRPLSLSFSFYLSVSVSVSLCISLYLILPHPISLSHFFLASRRKTFSKTLATMQFSSGKLRSNTISVYISVASFLYSTFECPSKD